VDPLAAHDLVVSRETSPADKLVQAFELMETGFRLKRATLRAALPGSTERGLDEAFERWLLGDG
jgi:hypothetical protein